MNSFLRMTVFVTCIAVLAACSRERQDWKSAQAADTIEAYGSFLSKHGDSALATQAEARVKQLGEERDWQDAATVDTLEAYQAYLRQHPQSKWAQEARIRVENFALAGNVPAAPASSSPAPAAAAGTGLAAAAGAAPAATPGTAPVAGDAARSVAATPPPAAPPVSAPASQVSAPAPRVEYGVQLGAFSTEGKAHAEWQRISGQYDSVLGGLSPVVAPVKSGSGSLYRLRVSTASESAARGICESLRGKGQPCVVVLPVGK